MHPKASPESITQKQAQKRVTNQLSDLVSTSLGQVLWQARTASSGR
jgi:hypothetical protein